MRFSSPLDMVQARDSVLTSNSKQIVIEDSYPNRSTTGRRRCNLGGPLVCLRVVSFYGVQIRLTVMSANSIEQIIEDSNANTTPETSMKK